MKKRIFGLMVVILIASFVFTACERPASVSPTVAPTSGSEIPFPVATQPQIMLDILKATQTAAALTQQAGGSPSLMTSTPAFTFNTPDAATTAGPTNTPGAKPTSTPIVYATPTPGKPATYEIQPGEFPWCIARRFDINPSDLLSLNGLNVNSQPAVGFVLKIPTSGSFGGTRALIAHPATYTVVTGDTMGKIACAFGDADPNTIYAANGLKVGKDLKVGKVLQIP